MASLPELELRWARLCARPELGDWEALEWSRMVTAYGEPARAYHNLDHIEHCLELLDEHRALATDALSLEFAIWLHDIIYETRAKDNERQCALFARSLLMSTCPQIAQSVEQLILATEHNAESLTGDSALMADIDLAMLGASPEAYNDYAAKVRREYAWVTPSKYVAGRSAVLECFLQRERIFQTAEFRAEFEQSARHNLSRELAALGI
ncbi:HD domain-containing protein [Cerasicoccus maritimus]|uniref:HD domain-containing protein n=1 Tax=Cerasicoccus maritimus TaxID=490089 RepID=UPI0028527347|nr:hypothetical protein [Cerasicoccus maritimus]